MYRDSSVLNQHDKETMGIKLNAKDGHELHMTGEIIDKVYKNGVLVDTIVGHNLVVDSFLKLVMCLLKQESGYKGVQYWAIGSGLSSWDSSTPAPENGATALTNELGRVEISAKDIIFLDSSFEKSATPTNILQITHTFTESECNGTWREFGIFGGNATTAKNSGILINKRHHAVLTKTNEMTVERTMRFTLNLA